jgi:hypothetical protein
MKDPIISPFHTFSSPDASREFKEDLQVLVLWSTSPPSICYKRRANNRVCTIGTNKLTKLILATVSTCSGWM